MELRRRFAFRGNAAAFGGRIVRPEDVVLEMPGASSLGISRRPIGFDDISGTPAGFRDFVTFKIGFDLRRRSLRRSEGTDRACRTIRRRKTRSSPRLA